MNNFEKVNKEDFWEERYKGGKTPWDIGQVAPAFVKYFKANEELKDKQQKVAVLGCGRAYDAFYLATLKESNVAQPLQVYGFDFSASAIKHCNKLKKKNRLNNINFYQMDFFDLFTEPKWKDYFDFVIEHTSFCAIDPTRRKEYAELIKYLLKFKGKLVGLFFIRAIKLGGPPFGTSLEEIRKYFSSDFIELEKLHYGKCLHTFTGEEYFGVFEKVILK